MEWKITIQATNILSEDQTLLLVNQANSIRMCARIK